MLILTHRNKKSDGASKVNKFLSAMQVWNKKSTKQRKAILHNAGRDPILASRSYPYMPKDVREDIQPTLLKEVPPVAAKSYWWQEA